MHLCLVLVMVSVYLTLGEVQLPSVAASLQPLVAEVQPFSEKKLLASSVLVEALELAAAAAVVWLLAFVVEPEAVLRSYITCCSSRCRTRSHLLLCTQSQPHSAQKTIVFLQKHNPAT